MSTQQQSKGAPPGPPIPSTMLVSSTACVVGPAHDVVHVWNRGGKAGELTVMQGDGAELAALIAAAPDMLTTLRAVSLHLMVRPQNRLPLADENVAALVREVIEKAKGGA